MRLAVIPFALLALAGCVGTPPIDRVTAEAEASGACAALPEGVTCDCVVSTAHTLIPTMRYDRNAAEDTGSRLGRGTIGAPDPRVAPALEAARQSCAAGKAVG
ncbi:MAG: hypothetical protein B7Z38_06815 [Rhodobacterales bacterium 12-64-8]|nr:MAG: hypothetical protein B7Z38_06815 [Rhodobacterales bacterium 12-64-8]